MSRQDGILRVVLTGKWYDMIERGEKLEEYRGEHWSHRLLWDGTCWNPPLMREDHFIPYHTIVASRGYTARTLTRKIKRIRWGTPRPEWSGDTVTGDCFVIELEAHTAQGEHPADRVEGETEEARTDIVWGIAKLDREEK